MNPSKLFLSMVGTGTMIGLFAGATIDPALKAPPIAAWQRVAQERATASRTSYFAMESAPEDSSPVIARDSNGNRLTEAWFSPGSHRQQAAVQPASETHFASAPQIFEPNDREIPVMSEEDARNGGVAPARVQVVRDGDPQAAPVRVYRAATPEYEQDPAVTTAMGTSDEDSGGIS